MARPEKKRNVFAPPSFSNFKPVGVRLNNIEQMLLSLDEYKALRLADYDNLEHSEAAEDSGMGEETIGLR